MGTVTERIQPDCRNRHNPVPGDGRGGCRRKRLPSSAGGPTEGMAMDRLREKAKARESADRRTQVALALTGLVLVWLAVLGLASQAKAARDPSSSAFLEGALKPQMQTKLRKSIPGLV